MMNIIELEVPDYVEFISDWKGYSIPEGHCIVDKDICGCGYTEYCIRPENAFNAILCSPRIALLDSKSKDHLGEPGFFYFENQSHKKEFMVLSGIKSEKSIDKKFNQEFHIYIKEKLINHLNNCRIGGFPCKIICTYDSFYIIKNALRPFLQDFKVIVDEFQSVFMDAFFKPEVEEAFFRNLQDVPNVTYLSATPMLDKYLERVDGFKNLPYYKMKWPDFRISEAIVHEKWVSDVEAEALKIINIYKNRKLDRPWSDSTGQVIYSNEVVFYINSVTMIKKIIQKAKLCPSECTIICSGTSEKNKKLIKNMKSPDNDKFSIEGVPERGKPHKMFTFCTRTTYLGADFYSDNAYTVILSDANIDSLVVDIRLDLPQILGRQRMKENPWKNECIIFYKTTRAEEEIDFTEEEFYKYLSDKEFDSKKIIETYKDYKFPERFIRAIIKSVEDEGRLNYFISLNSNGVPMVNEFMKLAEERAWELTRKDYRTRFNVIRSINEVKYTKSDTYFGQEDVIVQALIDQMKNLTIFDQKLELYCEFRDKFKDNEFITGRTLVYYRGTDLENLYSHFGIDTCRSVSFRARELKKRLSNEVLDTPLKREIYNSFVLNSKYSLKDIKIILLGIYKRVGINRTPKASDLENYFNVRLIYLYDQTEKKRLKGYELISFK